MFSFFQRDRQATGVERWMALIGLGVPALIFDAFAVVGVYRLLMDPSSASTLSWQVFLVFGGLALFFTYLTVRVARSSAQTPAFGIVLRSVMGLMALAFGLRLAIAQPDGPVVYSLLCLGFSLTLLRSVVVMWRQGQRPFGLTSRAIRPPE